MDEDRKDRERIQDLAEKLTAKVNSIFGVSFTGESKVLSPFCR